jgi:hypothetical protein
MAATTEELVAIARAHATAEARDDFETTMATLDDDPVYELLPVGLAFRGRDAARTYYEHFFTHVKPMVTGYELRNEWSNDRGLAQEYVIDFRPSGAPVERHHVLSILTFGVAALSGERLYASDRCFELLFGPVLALAHPLP